MNNFAVIEKLEQFVFDKVTYYSVRFQGKENNEFYDFLTRMDQDPEVEEDIGNLLVWIEEIGNKYGAIRERFFRHEAKGGELSALPPPRSQMEYHEIIVETLRLYCLVANEHVVFLFNGGVKTTAKPVDCPNVKKHFLKANDFARRIDECFRSGDISWNEDHTDIIIDPDLEIEI